MKAVNCIRPAHGLTHRPKADGNEPLRARQKLKMLSLRAPTSLLDMLGHIPENTRPLPRQAWGGLVM